MNNCKQQNTKIYNTCIKCKYAGCIYDSRRESLACPTWCKNYLKSAHSNCKCILYLSNDDTHTCEYFEEGKTLCDDELIDKENADYKRYIRIAKRRNFDDA